VIQVILELPDHRWSCACGCRKHSVEEEISELLKIVPMQVCVIKHAHRVYAYHCCETALVMADNTPLIPVKCDGPLWIVDSTFRDRQKSARSGRSLKTLKNH
jgi:hypothetical protein